MNRYPREMTGYGANPPDPKWPGKANIAVQFVINYEEGGENNILHGDIASEAFLSEIIGATAWKGQRHWNMESIYEYGARAGFWRLYRLFEELEIPATVYGVATALARAPEQVAAMQEANWEIASHGLKWIDYKDFSIEDERAHMLQAIAIHQEVTGSRPSGWYTGRCSANTVDMIAEEGGFAYVSDSYADDLPYWYEHDSGHQLVIPYTLDANDMRFATAQGFNSGDQFYTYLKDTFDTLYAEGQAGQAKMMNIGLHCRIIGRPGRIKALRQFMEYAKSHDQVWFAKRVEIADHWHNNHKPEHHIARPSNMTHDEFITHYGSVFEHSPWIAKRAFEDELGPAHNNAIGLHAALARKFRNASKQERLEVLKAHPDLAGKLTAANKLTAESNAEQTGAGLDTLTKDEHVTFTTLNTAYMNKFGFPFIIAVKGLDKNKILHSFKQRIENSTEQEFQTACQQVERIALLRLKDILP